MNLLLEILFTALFGVFAIISFIIAEAEREERKKNRNKNP